MTLPDPGRVHRRARLLADIQTLGGEWTTGRVQAHYKTTGLAIPLRATARGDLGDLARRGLLALHEHRGRRFYTARKTSKGGATA